MTRDERGIAKGLIRKSASEYRDAAATPGLDSVMKELYLSHADILEKAADNLKSNTTKKSGQGSFYAG